MQWFHCDKKLPLKLFFKDTLSEEFPFSTIDLRKAGRTGRSSQMHTTDINLPPLYQEPIKI